MAGIGEILREARMRRRVDMADVEAATKIRSKYLRALENEEWDLLPGPTFVKTFLRTYAEYLGLDARNLVEEYKQRYERPRTQDLKPLGPPVVARRRRRTPRPVLTPWLLIVVGAVVLVGALYALGKWGPDGGDESAAPNTVQRPTATPTPVNAAARRARERARRRAAAAKKVVRLRIEAQGLVEVCLVDAHGRRLLDAKLFTAGERSRTFKAKRFRVGFGNGSATMRINGRAVDVPDRAEPIGFALRAAHKPVELPSSQRPVCA